MEGIAILYGTNETASLAASNEVTTCTRAMRQCSIHLIIFIVGVVNCR